MRWRKCDHDWKVLVDKRFLSPASEFLLKQTTSTRVEYFVPQTYKSEIVVILACTHCGELNKTVKTL